MRGLIQRARQENAERLRAYKEDLERERERRERPWRQAEEAVAANRGRSRSRSPDPPLTEEPKKS
jgi:hypothetical protein